MHIWEKVYLLNQHKSYGENQWSALKSNQSIKGREKHITAHGDSCLSRQHVVYQLHKTCSNVDKKRPDGDAKRPSSWKRQTFCNFSPTPSTILFSTGSSSDASTVYPTGRAGRWTVSRGWPRKNAAAAWYAGGRRVARISRCRFRSGTSLAAPARPSFASLSSSYS
jgi:hypothetical protein